VKALVYAVGDSAVIEQGGEHFLGRTDDVVDATDVQEGFLLAGKGGIRQVFGGGGGAYCNGQVVVPGGELCEGLADGTIQRCGEVGLHDPLPDLAAGARQRIDVIDIQRIQSCVDALVEPTLLEKFAISVRSGGEATRDGNTRTGQIADHFAKRGVLAAHTLDVPNTQLLKGHYVL